MWQGLSGMRADCGYSHKKLEKIAALVRDSEGCRPCSSGISGEQHTSSDNAVEHELLHHKGV